MGTFPVTGNVVKKDQVLPTTTKLDRTGLDVSQPVTPQKNWCDTTMAHQIPIQMKIICGLKYFAFEEHLYYCVLYQERNAKMAVRNGGWKTIALKAEEL